MSTISTSHFTLSEIKNFPESLYPNLFSSHEWLRVLADQYDFKILCIQHKGTNCFLPAAKINHFGLKKIKIFPFCDYIIPSANSADSLQKLVNYLKKNFPETLIQLKLILPEKISITDLPYSLEHTAYRHIVNTSIGINGIKKNMDNSFKRGVRKAKSHKLNISISKNKKAISSFYDIYCKQRILKFKKLPQPYSFFQLIFNNFIANDKGFILEARKNSTIVASMIILEHQQKLYYKFGCSLDEYLYLRPNNLLFNELFDYATKKNFTHVDLGLSGVSENYKGLVRFKEYMGGKPTDIHSLRLEPENYNSSAEDELNAFMNALTRTIIAQNPDTKTANAYSQIMYPYFA